MRDLLEIKDVTKCYGRKTALDKVSFTVEKGNIVGLLGPNGSGKTTLIKIVNTLLTDYTGTVLVEGHPLGVESKKRISYLPDIKVLPGWMKVRDAVAMYRDYYEDFDDVKALEMLKTVGVEEKQTVKGLSKGTQEKLHLVLVMARRARLYIFDEPMAGVDPASRDFILKTILTNYSEDGSILLSTHLISDIEAILDRAVFLKEGAVILDDDVEAVRETNKMSVDQLFREVFKC